MPIIKRGNVEVVGVVPSSRVKQSDDEVRRRLEKIAKEREQQKNIKTSER